MIEVKKQNPITIIYACDDRFCEVMAVSITSLFKNNVSKSFNIVVLYSDLLVKNKHRIDDLCHEFDRNIPIWIDTKSQLKKLGSNIRVDRGSLSQFSRIFIGSLLPSDAHKAIYLDCDTMIIGNITKLWNINLNGNTIAALSDAFSVAYRKNINLSDTSVMFNSGVMLIDLDKWRENKIEKHLIGFINKKNGVVQQGDQGVLNAVLSDSVEKIAPSLNMVSIFFDFNYNEILEYRKPVEFYSKKEINDAINNPVIIHFTTSFLSKRPWYSDSKHPYRDKWLEYRRYTFWKDSNLWPKKNGFQAVLGDIFHILPRSFAIHIAGFFQAYVRPYKNKIIGELKH